MKGYNPKPVSRGKKNAKWKKYIDIILYLHITRNTGPISTNDADGPRRFWGVDNG